MCWLHCIRCRHSRDIYMQRRSKMRKTKFKRMVMWMQLISLLHIIKGPKSPQYSNPQKATLNPHNCSTTTPHNNNNPTSCSKTSSTSKTFTSSSSPHTPLPTITRTSPKSSKPSKCFSEFLVFPFPYRRKTKSNSNSCSLCCTIWESLPPSRRLLSKCIMICTMLISTIGLRD